MPLCLWLTVLIYLLAMFTKKTQAYHFTCCRPSQTFVNYLLCLLLTFIFRYMTNTMVLLLTRPRQTLVNY